MFPCGESQPQWCATNRYRGNKDSGVETEHWFVLSQMKIQLLWLVQPHFYQMTPVMVGSDDKSIKALSPVCFYDCGFTQLFISLDTNNQLPLDEEFTNTGQEETSPFPEGTSGYGSSTADPLDHVSTEPTLQTDTVEFSPETVTVLSQTETTQTDDEPTQADDSLTTLDMASGEAPTESTGRGHQGRGHTSQCSMSLNSWYNWVILI